MYMLGNSLATTLLSKRNEIEMSTVVILRSPLRSSLSSRKWGPEDDDSGNYLDLSACFINELLNIYRDDSKTILCNHSPMETSLRKKALQQRQIHISCVVPVHNESAGIISFLSALRKKLQDHTDHISIIVVDDGSRDDTAAKVATLAETDPTLKLLVFSRNFGKENALTAGIEHSGGDVTILVDADFQHPLNLIDTFLERWSEGYDMVYGIQEDRQHETVLKRGFTKMFYHLLQSMTQTAIPPNAGDFRLFDRSVTVALCSMHERSRFMKGMYAWVGFNSIGIPFAPTERQTGSSSYRFKKLLELALTGITAFSDVPLRVWGVIGLIISFISLSYGIWIIFDTLLYGVDVPGYATLVVAIMFFGGIQLLSIGILGEYVGRIFQEVKQRPSYILKQKIGF